MCITIFRQVFQVPLCLFWDGLCHCVAQAGLSLRVLPTSASVCGVAPGLCHCPQPYILPKDALSSPDAVLFSPFIRSNVIAVNGERSWYKNMIRLTQWVISGYGHMCATVHGRNQRTDLGVALTHHLVWSKSFSFHHYERHLLWLLLS